MFTYTIILRQRRDRVVKSRFLWVRMWFNSFLHFLSLCGWSSALPKFLWLLCSDKGHRERTYVRCRTWITVFIAWLKTSIAEHEIVLATELELCGSFQVTVLNRWNYSLGRGSQFFSALGMVRMSNVLQMLNLFCTATDGQHRHTENWAMLVTSLHSLIFVEFRRSKHSHSRGRVGDTGLIEKELLQYFYGYKKSGLPAPRECATCRSPFWISKTEISSGLSKLVGIITDFTRTTRKAWTFYESSKAAACQSPEEPAVRIITQRAILTTSTRLRTKQGGWWIGANYALSRAFQYGSWAVYCSLTFYSS